MEEESNGRTDQHAFPSEPDYDRRFTPIQGILLGIILSAVLWLLIGRFVAMLIRAAG